MDSMASTSEELLIFRYVWSLKINKKLINTGEKAVLHVSPPFCTAYNGCQFTWLLRMCDERVLEMANLDNFDDLPSGSSQRVNVTLYYKDGPIPDVGLHSAAISVTDQSGRKLLKDTPLDGQEYILGSGWSPSTSDNSRHWSEFSEFVHNNVGTHISVSIDLKIRASLFQPLNYLPSLESADSKLEFLCEKILKEIFTQQLQVPNSDLLDVEKDKFAYHKNIFNFSCQEVQKRLDDALRQQISSSKIETVCAHIYFNHVIMAETVCFEDFLDILEASVAVHFPALKWECERFICREVMVESADLDFVKKMLLLAERFQLPVLKMVSAGALVDKLILADEAASSNMREELLQIADQITATDESDFDDESTGDEKSELVHSVVDQLESLAKHIRKVSLSASCGNLSSAPGGHPGVFAAPLPPKDGGVPNGGQLPPRGRRSSLKTSRELLAFHTGSMDSDGSSLNNSPLLSGFHPRRRSIMFSMQSFADDEEDYDEGDESEVGSSSDQDSAQAPVTVDTPVRPEVTTHFAVPVGP